ncbi:MAG TPA: insulinase family protein [Leeuwenhoekiella sp.]|uniref:Peptidase family M16 n=1 Tax=Leeuwenhoekiella blandensis (strain CECT 7118 / CCUG 51940 / KCTC 22103 / MED217) TaxID=398720 RepID=A3XQ79_LEEBM|nr:pitrilysin family protein [Leeuwenhoekiella blandensis]MBH13365.1 insulinase family protein [Leeuwenhoekiella sp.]EAQ48296.1 peptidase family M16 [Leeuwenhoekiella blandensis MED217]HAX16556.1 insulinase family protein [Leeuwenhoekiella sp.]HBO30789.1 insulinase family protein [Leeuwenhoekiella sp.]HCQ77150.1 insulinase family protein [Leeuwenhoekiella sp.]|tara:strand:- start:8343 stop:9662 length:1320 start_codon:yes stop_codon:yes gene_type:complete
MKKTFFSLASILAMSLTIQAQEVEFEEYDLDNGLHVILHQDNTAPVVTTSVMYHVGGKDREDGRTGFAHFFEHLLFEGTENIENGKWFEIVSSNGGTNNANTSQDRTYYYEVFPSNNLELGLWMESERMLHPIIKQDGVDTQNEVVKEERRLRYDNSPYGQFLFAISEQLFKNHPYKDPNVGYMEDLDAASLQEFQDYFKKYYKPNNAVLVVAGDIEVDETKKMIEDYFGPIPSGPELERSYPTEAPITEATRTQFYDSNIQVPAILTAYRTPGYGDRDAYVLNMISSYLSDGKSSKLYKKMVDDEKKALQIGAINLEQEDYGMYIIFGLPLGETSLDTLLEGMEEEIAKLRNELISESDYEKLQNKAETNFVNSNSSVSGIANTLARNYMLYDDTNLINSEIEIYRSITREEIKEVANKYLKPNQRVEVEYLPKKEEQ